VNVVKFTQQLVSKFVLLLVFTAFAQKLNAQIAFSAEFGTLRYEAQSANAPQYGFGLSIRTDITPKLKAGAVYSRFNSREGSGADFRRVSMNPVTGFFEYRFLNGDFSPFASADFGFYINREVRDNQVSSAGLDFGFAPGGGLLYRFSDGFVLGAIARYHFVYRENDFVNILGVTLTARSAF
jgi:hypothetical protein